MNRVEGKQDVGPDMDCLEAMTEKSVGEVEARCGPLSSFVGSKRRSRSQVGIEV